MPLLDELSDDAADLGAVNTVRVPRRPDARPQHRLVRLRPGVPAGRCPTPWRTASCSSAPAGPGVAVGYGLLEQGAAHVAVLDADRDRADACAVRLAKRFGDDRVGAVTDLARALDDAQGLVNATPIGMLGHPGTAVPGRRWSAPTCGSPTSSTSRWRPS